MQCDRAPLALDLQPGVAAGQRLGGLGVKVGEGASVAEARLPDAAAMRAALEAALARAPEGGP